VVLAAVLVLVAVVVGGEASRVRGVTGWGLGGEALGFGGGTCWIRSEVEMWGMGLS
jgi:hypothetical protein